MKILKELTPKKCSGYDDLPMVILEDGHTQLATILTRLFNIIIETGKMPGQWKIANNTKYLKKRNQMRKIIDQFQI